MRRARHATRRALGIEPLENRKLMAGDVAMAISDGELDISGPAKSVDMEITNWGGFYKVAGQNGTTINGHDYQYIHSSWVDDITIDLPGMSGSARIQNGSSLHIDGIAVSGDLNVQMSQSHDSFSMVQVETTGSVNIETFTGNDDIQIGGKGDDFNTIGRSLNIDSGSDYDTLQIVGLNVVKDDATIEAGEVGPQGSAEFLTISGLSVGGFGVDQGRNDLSISSTSHVDLLMTSTYVARDLSIVTLHSGSHLTASQAYVGRDLTIITGDSNDEILVKKSTVGRDLGIASDHPWTADAGHDHVYVQQTSVGRDMYVHTNPISGSGSGSDSDYVSLWKVDIDGTLQVKTGGGDDYVGLMYVQAHSATFDGGEGYDRLSLHHAAFEDWSEVEMYGLDEINWW